MLYLNLYILSSVTVRKGSFSNVVCICPTVHIAIFSYDLTNIFERKQGV